MIDFLNVFRFYRRRCGYGRFQSMRHAFDACYGTLFARNKK